MTFLQLLVMFLALFMNSISNLTFMKNIFEFRKSLQLVLHTYFFKEILKHVLLIYKHSHYIQGIFFHCTSNKIKHFF